MSMFTCRECVFSVQGKGNVGFAVAVCLVPGATPLTAWHYATGSPLHAWLAGPCSWEAAFIAGSFTSHCDLPGGRVASNSGQVAQPSRDAWPVCQRPCRASGASGCWHRPPSLVCRGHRHRHPGSLRHLLWSGLRPHGTCHHRLCFSVARLCWFLFHQRDRA